MISVRGLKKKYGKREILKGININVRKGEIVGLLGPNGAGKTTTFRTILGEISPDQGEITLNGKRITHHPMWKRVKMGIGYLPQKPSIFKGLSVEENIRVYLEFSTFKRREKREILFQVMEELGIAHLRHRRASLLSGGERRKLEVARALSLKPAFMLLDEPFTGIDPITVKEMRRIILDLMKKGVGVIITDHNVRETLKITHRAYIINKGEILAWGSPGEIYRNPLVREKFLGRDFHLEEYETEAGT